MSPSLFLQFKPTWCDTFSFVVTLYSWGLRNHAVKTVYTLSLVDCLTFLACKWRGVQAQGHVCRCILYRCKLWQYLVGCLVQWKCEIGKYNSKVTPWGSCSTSLSLSKYAENVGTGEMTWGESSLWVGCCRDWRGSKWLSLSRGFSTMLCKASNDPLLIPPCGYLPDSRLSMDLTTSLNLSTRPVEECNYTICYVFWQLESTLTI